ncbi:ArsR/SmtB family transcription factor [Dokdonella fugitiva]|uniref:ArsR/SmtB family transcription factor n=1 Tax=Dokdonella fugitiva TaxID=328517 RepID=UPI003CCCF31E
MAPATASAHLQRLVSGGLLAVHAQGRHRYFHLADEDVAHLVETLPPPRRPARRRAVRVPARARCTRTRQRRDPPQRGGRALAARGRPVRRRRRRSRARRAQLRRLDRAPLPSRRRARQPPRLAPVRARLAAAAA